jgi:short-subunit dehydrogenase
MSSGKIIFITGASSGIGYATALEFAKIGAHVVGTARRLDRLEQLKSQINDLPAGHGDFLPISADVQNADEVKSAIDQAIAHFGRIDVLIANAGVGHRGSLAEASWDEVQTLLRTNIDGVLHSVRAVVPIMKAQGGGHIMLISSVVYNMTAPYTSIYAASKAFVSSMAKSLRLELERDNIHVSDMLVGRTESEFNDKRMGAGGRNSVGRFPIMTTEKVAKGIVRASAQKRRAVAFRLFDRLILMGNLLVPTLIGRRAMRHYK